MTTRSGWCLPDHIAGRCHNHEECTRRGGCEGCPDHREDDPTLEPGQKQEDDE